ncbi:hypothetical protein EVAR_92370_1 [Eumeta japonica]|uniref:Uncharacterized protein n=1 Tax=Eumeta variegata TaxID=151549 RepID=A0A4C1TLX0_EUMVA|nr:hypothetical protein EVAR_92370_1 [Eumeta japonica]
MPRVLGEDDIINILLEDIPSDGESVCSFESDDENNFAPENDLMVFCDLSSELQPQFDSDFDSDDDIPLSNLCTAFANSISLPTQTEVVQPKWSNQLKSTYAIDRKSVQAKNSKSDSKRSLSASSSPLPVQIKKHKPSVPRGLRLESSMHQQSHLHHEDVQNVASKKVWCELYDNAESAKSHFVYAKLKHVFLTFIRTNFLS